MKPRCGAEMHAYEAVWGALLDPVLCGRPEGHVGRHRSEQAIRKERDRGRRKWAEYSRLRRQRAAQERMRAELVAAVEASAKHAKDMAMRTREVNW